MLILNKLWYLDVPAHSMVNVTDTSIEIKVTENDVLFGHILETGTTVFKLMHQDKVVSMTNFYNPKLQPIVEGDLSHNEEYQVSTKLGRFSIVWFASSNKYTRGYTKCGITFNYHNL